jgi:hypothetical protein
MNNINEIESFAKLQRLINIFQRVSQISWSSDQTRKRYPAPEVMSPSEIESLTRLYLALGLDIEEIYKEWLKEYKEYKDGKK